MNIIETIGVSSDYGKVDISEIEEFETKIGYCLPITYKELISKNNGLYPIKDSFNFINIYGKEDEASIYFLGYGDVDYDKIENSQESVSNPLHYGLKGLVCFGGYGNGDYICFDYRADPTTCNPKVIHMYHDDYVENEDGTSTSVINSVANSFEEFIDMLYEDTE